MLVLETCGTFLACLGELAVDVLLHHERSNGNAISCSPSAILHINADGYLWVLAWSKAHEDAVVLAMRILSRSCLAAYFIKRSVGNSTGSSQHSLSHALDDCLVVLPLNLCIVLLGVCRVERHSLHFLHNMRDDVPASVGDGGSKVGYLQRRQVDLALSDADTDDGQTAPILFISLVVVWRVWNHTAFLTWQVDAELVAKAHADHIVLPSRHRLLYVLVLCPVAEHVVKPPAEVGIT